MEINKLNKADLLLYKDYLAMQLYNLAMQLYNLATQLYSKIDSEEYYDKILSEYKSVCKKLSEINNGKK